MGTLAENVAKVVAANKAIGDAIAAKGVTVPADSRLSDKASLISQIETAGADDDGWTKRLASPSRMPYTQRHQRQSWKI